jgi:hypothetical protein
MKTPLYAIAAILLLAGLSAANAAPAVPSSELPGRERDRFTPSPLDRFMQPIRPTEPLVRWDCHEPGTSRWKQRSKRNKDC